MVSPYLGSIQIREQVAPNLSGIPKSALCPFGRRDAVRLQAIGISFSCFRSSAIVAWGRRLHTDELMAYTRFHGWVGEAIHWGGRQPAGTGQEEGNNCLRSRVSISKLCKSATRAKV
jgi:hypothetical protein